MTGYNGDICDTANLDWHFTILMRDYTFDDITAVHASTNSGTCGEWCSA